MEAVEAALERAAAWLAGCRRLLILTGAGMSAESGIPTFRDEGGYWRRFPPFARLGLAAQDLASPWAFRHHLAHAWAFYEWRRRNAAANRPHPGYAVVTRWLTEGRFDAFVHTTNTDGYHLRAGVPPERLREVHGSMWRLQCLRPCSPHFWPEERVPLCRLHEATMEAEDFPRCPRCGGVARPHILMFGDGDYVGHPEQDRRFAAYLEGGVEVALLIGASGAVPTNDLLAARLQRGGCRVVTINPDPAAGGHLRPDAALHLPASEALARLEQRLASG
ncbi:MAG: iron dicitrate transport regulator FecR [Nitrospirae bacterium]|nr:MAG: iron dicitrate transport regulator FecR [Nitrospirota bacterium]